MGSCRGADHDLIPELLGALTLATIRLPLFLCRIVYLDSEGTPLTQTA